MTLSKRIWSTLRQRRDVLVLFLLSTVPFFYTHPGWMTADTKIYLYTNPAKLMSRALSLWDSHVGLGTVTHQNLGYLFPMGPYYWLMENLGVPDWVALRCWWSGLLFFAALGARSLARRLGVEGRFAFIAGCLYAFGPYYLQYLSKESGLLPAWSAAPWLIICAIEASRHSGWRWPARFGLIVCLISSLNASTPLYVLIGPAVWLIADVFSGRLSVRQLVVTGARCAITTLGLCYWWIAGLSVQKSFGLPILRFTETYEAIVKTSLPQEILRGIGYWFFYGDDKSGHWVTSSTQYMTSPLVITVGLSIVLLSLLGLAATKYRFRVNIIALVVVGLGVAVAGAPTNSPSPYGRLFKEFVKSDSGLAMRSTPRAAPIMLLGLAIGFATAVAWIVERASKRWAHITVAIALCLIVVNGFPLFTGGSMSKQYMYKSVPKYWTDVADRLDATKDRVYEFPGTDFPNYNWGGTVDPVTPGLTDASIIARELVPLGSEPTADLLNAMETRQHNGWFEPQTLVGFSRLISANRLLLRNDLNYRKYRTPRPAEMWWSLTKSNFDPIFTGPNLTDAELNRITDGQSMSQPQTETAPSVALFDTGGRYQMITAAKTSSSAIVFGDGSGLVDIAALDLVGGLPSFLYDISTDSAAAGEVSRYFLTDTNRRQARHWYGVGFNVGRTERADELPVDDPSDSRLEPFASSTSDQQTVSQLVGDVATINATGYGNNISFTDEDRPENAFDGDPRTAWRTAVFRKSTNESITVTLRKPVTTDRITLLQPQVGAAYRDITRIRIETDGGNAEEFELNSASTIEPGQTIKFAQRTFSVLKITVLDDSFGNRASYAGIQGVGFAEISIPGISSSEYLRLPKIDLTKYTNIEGSDWTVILTRDRIMQSTSNQFEHEVNIQRLFNLPVSLAPKITITARLSGMAEDDALASALAVPLNISASRHLYGSPANAGMNAMDGDPLTAWTAPMQPRVRSVLSFKGQTERAESLVITAIADGRHSIPTEATIVDTEGTKAVLPLRIENGQGYLRTPEGFGVIASISFTATDPVFVRDYFSGVETEMPVAISEIVVNDQQNRTAPQQSECRSDLLEIDGDPVAVRMPVLTFDQRWNRQPFDLQLCQDVPRLLSGDHQVRTAKGWDTGIDIDRIAFGDLTAATGTSVAVTSTRHSDTSFSAVIPASNHETLLILNQSINNGWKATLDGEDLGDPLLVNGYANGWRIPASESAAVVQIRWTPQDKVHRGILISFLFGFVCLILAFRPARSHADTMRRVPSWLVPTATGVALLFFGGIGALAGVLMVIAARRMRHLQAVVGLLATTAVGLVWAGIMYKQLRYRIPASMDWPSHFTALAPITWFAVAVVAFLAASRPDDPNMVDGAD